MRPLMLFDEIMDIRQAAERLGRRHRAIREELGLQGDHILTGQRMLDVHQALCRAYPKQGKQRLPAHLRYGVAFMFVKEHLIQALKEKHKIRLTKQEEQRARRLIGAIYFRPPTSEHMRRAKAAEALKESGWWGKQIYAALCKEVEHLRQEDDKFTGMHRGKAVEMKPMQPGETPATYRVRLVAEARAATERKGTRFLNNLPTDLFSNVIPKFEAQSGLVEVARVERETGTTFKGRRVDYRKRGK